MKRIGAAARVTTVLVALTLVSLMAFSTSCALPSSADDTEGSSGSSDQGDGSPVTITLSIFDNGNSGSTSLMDDTDVAAVSITAETASGIIATGDLEKSSSCWSGTVA